MELVPAGIPLSFEVTYDVPGLNVAMSVYDDSGASPVLLLSPFAMALVHGSTYRGKFTPVAGKNYIIIKAVYTDGTFAELDPDYSQGSESCVCQYLVNAQVCSVVGIVNAPQDTCSTCTSPTFTIFQGDAKTICLKTIQNGCNGDPLDLTYCTEIDIILPNLDGTFTQLLYSLGQVVIASPANLGKFSAAISSEVSTNLNAGALQDLDVTLTLGTQVITIPFIQALSVFERN